MPGDGEQIWTEQLSSRKARVDSLGMVQELESPGLLPALWSSKNKPGTPLGSLCSYSLLPQLKELPAASALS